MPFRAVVADDHPLFRAAMKQSVSAVLGEEIAESANFADTLACLQRSPEIEIVFLDLNMPGNEGLSGLSHLRRSHPDVLVVIVSATESPAHISRAMSLGASGYIPKSTPLEVIREAVEDIMDGEIWLPEGVSAELPDNAVSSEESEFLRNLELLTPQQFQVLKLMADGLLNKQIAYELGVKETTIKQHGSAILKKLGLNNRTQAGVLFKQVMSTAADAINAGE